MRLENVVRIGAFALGVAFALPVAGQQVTFMTGPQGGSWIPLGGALKNLWETAIPGMQIQQMPGAGIANVRGIDEGKAQVGFANSSTTVDGLEGRPPYPKKTAKVCQVANLYPQHFQVVALNGREGPLVRRPQEQVGGHAAERQHGRAPHRRRAEAQRHDLPVALARSTSRRPTPMRCR